LQWAQSGPVSAQGVGQHERVEAVVLDAGRAVTAAQVLDLVGADHHHGQLSAEQGVDDRAVGPFDRDLIDAVPAQEGDELAQPGCGVLNHRASDLAAAAVHDAHGVVVTSPVHPRGDVVGCLVGQGIAGRLHFSLLAASPSGEAPSCGAAGAGRCIPVRSLIGARRRSALTTVRTSRATTRS
jgi:hypothetical protein